MMLIGLGFGIVGCMDNKKTTNIINEAEKDRNTTDEVGTTINTYTVVSKSRISTKRVTKYDDVPFLICKAFIGSNDEDMTDVLGVLLVKDELLDYTQTRMGDTKSLLEWEFEITDYTDSALACGLIYSKDGKEVKQRSRNSYLPEEEPEPTPSVDDSNTDDNSTDNNTDDNNTDDNSTDSNTTGV